MAPLLGVIGVVLYGLLRLVDVFFYLRLQTTPEEVGFDYQKILGHQLIGTLEIVLLLTAFAIAVELVVRAARHAVARRWREAISLPSLADLKRLVQRRGLAALVLVLVALPMVAWEFGGEACKGYTVHNLYLLNIRIPVLAVQARPATVAWLSNQGGARPDLPKRGCLMYLGEAEGITVLYDVKSQEVLRVPTSQILLTLRKVQSLPESCVPESLVSR